MANLLRIAARVAANLSNPVVAEVGDNEMTAGKQEPSKDFYLVITDEPVGVAVGFRPSEEFLAEIGGELDPQWKLVEDDGSNGTPFLVDPQGEAGKPGEVIIRDAELQDMIDEGMSPLGMDLGVWRSEEEMQEALQGEIGHHV